MSVPGRSSYMASAKVRSNGTYRNLGSTQLPPKLEPPQRKDPKDKGNLLGVQQPVKSTLVRDLRRFGNRIAHVGREDRF